MSQVAYLASSLFLDHDSDLIILVVNTLTQDLRSDNYLTGRTPNFDDYDGITRVDRLGQVALQKARFKEMN